MNIFKIGRQSDLIIHAMRHFLATSSDDDFSGKLLPKAILIKIGPHISKIKMIKKDL